MHYIKSGIFVSKQHCKLTFVGSTETLAVLQVW